jgi:hypothetical protein
MTRARPWPWLVALIVAIGLAVVHAHLPSAGDLSPDRVASTAGAAEPADTDRADSAPEAASDLELFARVARSPRPTGLPIGATARAQFSSRALVPRERPPRTDRSRA